MSKKTKEKVLVAIAYLSLHGLEVNKNRVANYTGLTWLTVHRYFDDLYSLFLLEDIERFENQYKEKI